MSGEQRQGDDRFETVEIREIYRGTLLSLFREKVKAPDGEMYYREVVRGVRAAAIVAVTDLREVVLVRQYRQPTGEMVLEIPAGLIDPGETPEEAAARELQEETGFKAVNLFHLSDFYTTPGYSDELLSLFLATGLSEGVAAPEVDEELEVVKVPFDETVRMIDQGEIRDAKTIVGILLAGRGA
ncbi:MAG: NUDIX hydrolase [Actinobacteria bacterium]|nr:NUDIX hydrolase [Actinomycetota bacterium]